MKDAKELATSLMNTALSFNKKVIAFITDMNQPLGNYIGNWLEVYESIKVLQGEKVNDLLEVTLNLSGAMIYIGGKAKSIKEGIEISKEMIANGKAFQKFVELVELQNGDTSLLKNPEKYPKSKIAEKIFADKSGYVKSIDVYQIGMSAIELGGGRLSKVDTIDPKAGIVFHPKIGSKIKKGDLIAEIFTDKENAVDEVKQKITNAIKLSKEKVVPVKLIKSIMK